MYRSPTIPAPDPSTAAQWEREEAEPEFLPVPSSEERWPLPERWEKDRERMYDDGDDNERHFD